MSKINSFKNKTYMYYFVFCSFVIVKKIEIIKIFFKILYFLFSEYQIYFSGMGNNCFESNSLK